MESITVVAYLGQGYKLAASAGVAWANVYLDHHDQRRHALHYYALSLLTLTVYVLYFPRASGVLY